MIDTQGRPRQRSDVRVEILTSMRAAVCVMQFVRCGCKCSRANL